MPVLETTIVSHNIRNNPDMPRHKVRAAARDCTPFGIAGFQEIGDRGEDARDVKRGIGDKYRLQGARKHYTPIASRKGPWTTRGPAEFIKFHDGDADIPTPKRGGIAADLLHVKTEFPLTVGNFHFVNGAFNNEHPRTKEERGWLWVKSDDILRDWLHETIQRGDSVLLLGDFNNPNTLRYTANQVSIFNGGIDKMIFIPAAGVKAKVLSREHDDTVSDHPALRARIRISF